MLPSSSLTGGKGLARVHISDGWPSQMPRTAASCPAGPVTLITVYKHRSRAHKAPPPDGTCHSSSQGHPRVSVKQRKSRDEARRDTAESTRSPMPWTRFPFRPSANLPRLLAPIEFPSSQSCCSCGV